MKPQTAATPPLPATPLPGSVMSLHDEQKAAPLSGHPTANKAASPMPALKMEQKEKIGRPHLSSEKERSVDAHKGDKDQTVPI